VPGYSQKNLKEVEDSATKFGLSPDLEAHFAREALGGEQIALSYQRLAPNFRLPFGHHHKTQEEVYVIVSGSGRMKIGDDVVELEQWDAVRVPPDTMRGFEAGPDGLGLIAIGSPSTGPGDAEVTPGWWSD
jgi:mannose-6-phosphate isomerase-like protein (cupin superfamily)